MSGRPGISDREIASLEGGSLILEARERAARLLSLIPPSRPSGEGHLDGRQGLQRRGRPQDLLLSEHLHDDDEFLRRHHDGEQLFLSRESRRSTAAEGWAFWDLGPAALGSPRRVGIGLALALARQCALAGRRFRLVVQARLRLDLDSTRDVRRLLELPPRPSPAPEAWDGYLEEAAAGEEAEICWIASKQLRPAQDTGGPPAEAAALFLLDGHRVELRVRARGRRRAWKTAGAVSMEERGWILPHRPGV